VLEYDDVMNKQREVIYGDRRAILEAKFDTRAFMLQTLEEKVNEVVDQYAGENMHPSEWDLPEILKELDLIFPVRQTFDVAALEKLDREEIRKRLLDAAIEAYEAKEREITPEIMRVVESRYLMLPIIDRMWVDHLHVMDALKTGIGLRGYGQKDPRVEYEKEAYEIFEDLKNNIADEAIKGVFHVVVEHGPAEGGYGPSLGGGQAPLPPFEPIPSGQLMAEPVQNASRFDAASAEQLLGPMPAKQRVMHNNVDGGEPRKPLRADAKVGRNQLCPCGSGKKYKKCHGAAA